MAITGIGTNTNQYVATAGMSALGIPELATFHPFTDAPSYVIPYALIITTTDWNAAGTTPQAAYWFEAWLLDPTSHQLIKVEGQGYVANASVSTTPVPRLINRAGNPGTPSIVTATQATMPAELAVFNPFVPAGSASTFYPTIAQIIYTGSYDATKTTPQIAYFFTMWLQHPTTPFAFFEARGIGWVVNPSVSGTVVPRLMTAHYGSGASATAAGNGFSVYAHTGGEVAFILEDTSGNGGIGLRNSLGLLTIQLEAAQYLDANHQVIGGQLAVWTSSGGSAVTAVATFPSVTVS
jgi:hypothetical protein